ncbi:MAG: OmpA family protein [Ketobacter sp.]
MHNLISNFKITALALVVSSSLLATACTSQQTKPDTAYTPSQEPEPTSISTSSISLQALPDTLATDPQLEPEQAPGMAAVDGDHAMAAADTDSRPAKTLFLFGFDQKDLDTDAESLLRQHGQFLAAHPEMKISINGHADPQGDAEYNRYLAQQRADYVARLLTDEGVGKEQILVRSWGAEAPAPAATHHRDNRRVELIYEDEYLVNYQSE